MLLARLAVDHREQGKGLAKALLKDAILRTIRAAEIAGLELLLVYAKDEAAAEFYYLESFDKNDPPSFALRRVSGSNLVAPIVFPLFLFLP